MSGYIPQHHTVVQKAGVVTTTPVTWTPEELLAREQESVAHESSWHSVYIPWHRDEGWYRQYEGQRLQLDAENRFLDWPVHWKLFATVAAGVLIGFTVARI